MFSNNVWVGLREEQAAEVPCLLLRPIILYKYAKLRQEQVLIIMNVDKTQIF